MIVKLNWFMILIIKIFGKKFIVGGDFEDAPSFTYDMYLFRGCYYILKEEKNEGNI